MNLLLDATLPPRLARALNLLVQPEHAAVHLRDALGNDASDLIVRDYLQSHPEAVVIGADLDIVDHPHRLQALREWGRPVFLLSDAWLKQKNWTQACMLFQRLPVILEKARGAPGPAIHLVPPVHKGSVRKIA